MAKKIVAIGELPIFGVAREEARVAAAELDLAAERFNRLIQRAADDADSVRAMIDHREIEAAARTSALMAEVLIQASEARVALHAARRRVDGCAENLAILEDCR